MNKFVSTHKVQSARNPITRYSAGECVPIVMLTNRELVTLYQCNRLCRRHECHASNVLFLSPETRMSRNWYVVRRCITDVTWLILRSPLCHRSHGYSETFRPACDAIPLIASLMSHVWHIMSGRHISRLSHVWYVVSGQFITCRLGLSRRRCLASHISFPVTETRMSCISCVVSGRRNTGISRIACHSLWLHLTSQ